MGGWLEGNPYGAVAKLNPRGYADLQRGRRAGGVWGGAAAGRRRPGAQAAQVSVEGADIRYRVEKASPPPPVAITATPGMNFW